VTVGGVAWAISSTDLTEHAVACSELRPGRFTIGALCGRTVVVAALSTPAVRSCPSCLAFLHARTTLRGLGGAPRAPRRWFGRLSFGRCGRR